MCSLATTEVSSGPALWEPHVSQQQQQSQMVAQSEGLMKWGRGDSFPALTFGNRRLTKTPTVT